MNSFIGKGGIYVSTDRPLSGDLPGDVCLSRAPQNRPLGPPPALGNREKLRGGLLLPVQGPADERSRAYPCRCLEPLGSERRRTLDRRDGSQSLLRGRHLYRRLAQRV